MICTQNGTDPQLEAVAPTINDTCPGIRALQVLDAVISSERESRDQGVGGGHMDGTGKSESVE